MITLALRAWIVESSWIWWKQYTFHYTTRSVDRLSIHFQFDEVLDGNISDILGIDRMRSEDLIVMQELPSFLNIISEDRRRNVVINSPTVYIPPCRSPCSRGIFDTPSLSTAILLTWIVRWQSSSWKSVVWYRRWKRLYIPPSVERRCAWNVYTSVNPNRLVLPLILAV